MLLSGGKFPLRFFDFGFQKRFQLGIQLKALIEVLICPDLVALKQPGQSSVSVCLGKGWIDIDGVVVVGHAALQVSPVLLSVAPIVVRFYKSGIDFDSSVVVCNSSLQVSFG